LAERCDRLEARLREIEIEMPRLIDARNLATSGMICVIGIIGAAVVLAVLK